MNDPMEQSHSDRWMIARQRLSDMASSLDARQNSDPEVAAHILKGRASVLARPLDESVIASEVVEVVTFRIGDERYALETGFIREVVEPGQITPVPGTPVQLVGVCNLRGDVLAIMNGASITGPIGQPQSETVGEQGGSVLVLGEDISEFGLLVTEVEEVTSLKTNSIGDPGAMGEKLGRLICGLTSDALIVIDGSELLSDPRFFIDGSDS